jgi:adenosylmethionine-8-amino-7-oxononanoate aminotransferase
MHGPTFMGNALACAISAASIGLLLDGNWHERVTAIGAQMADEFAAFRKHPAVKDVRVCGAIGVVETHREVNMGELQKLFVEHGVWIRPFGRLVYLMPPYIIEPDELSQLSRAIGLALDTMR